MTRLTPVDPARLLDQHLLAERREGMRPFALARAWLARGRPGAIPTAYRLGTGHVRFFYPRLGWLLERLRALQAESLDRGFQVAPLPAFDVPDVLQGTWAPTPEAEALALTRLAKRQADRPGWYRYRGEVVGPGWYNKVAP